MNFLRIKFLSYITLITLTIYTCSPVDVDTSTTQKESQTIDDMQVEAILLTDYSHMNQDSSFDQSPDIDQSYRQLDMSFDAFIMPDQSIDQDGDGFEQSQDCNDQNRDISPRAFELCDGLDNDCDDKVDEAHYDLNRTCSIGRGACQVIGVFICSPDLLGVICSEQEALRPTVEICNDSIDNDCDGIEDEPDDCAME